MKELRTDRLRLRRAAAADVERLHEISRLVFHTGRTLEQFRALHAEMERKEPYADGWDRYVVELPGGPIVGDLAIHFGRPGPRQVELGYGFDPSHQGKGYATEALRALLSHLFEERGFHRAIAVTGADNVRSQALLGRLGFRREGEHLESHWHRGEERFVDDVSYALLAREWRGGASAWASPRGVDAWLEATLVRPEDALAEARRASAAAGLPPHELSPLQAKLLALLARMIGARRVLELGTLGGVSAIALARAVGDGGRVVTIEASEAHAQVARENLARAGVEGRVELVVGRALEVLPGIDGPFDLAFLDADKASSPAYLGHALRLVRKGGVIVADNVVRNGALADAASEDESVRGVRRFLELVAAEPRLDATALQTVGAKGWDGFALALVVG